ncbi:DUF2244 domain-containing protein [Usitatibacter palustris]|uniref:DUF2244 domain-containing protein n=1 Tax=Usitatibacter palustris TaxID=2732487 RepID=A0A6M4H2A0_9PROT|nr:DUF2244 domain-containing protein [Usitatibacter palustris]QJR13616.1 hypothetical protein DSM104440_00400 [Usitatibacter palustris]
MAPSAESPAFVHLSVPNRSLGPRERRRALVAIAVTTMGVAAGAWALGAWPVMPFAGIEVALVWLAFHVVRKHDGDFERIEIDAGEVRLDACDARRESHFVANRAWARVVLREHGGQCTLGLAYAGKTVPLGRLLSDEGRRRLAQQIRACIPVTAN